MKQPIAVSQKNKQNYILCSILKFTENLFPKTHCIISTSNKFHF